jgi:nucleoside-diphosphate-sugar epimerase
MPKILIIGATGYLGQTLALSLLRSGNHAVYGIARSAAKAASLARLEITPVLCPDLVNDPKPVLDAIQQHNISVVVACGADQEAAKVLEVTLAAGNQRLEEYEKLNFIGPKLGFVYTSGTWVHGSSLSPITDLDPVGKTLSPTQPPSLVAWRPAMEQSVLRAKDILDVVVVRPGLIYGRSSAIWKSFFDPVVEATKAGLPSVQVPLEAGRPGLVHVDDTAEGLHCAVDKLPLLAGTGVYPVFDLVGHTESMQDVFDAFARAIEYNGKVELVGSGDNAFAEAMSTSGSNSSGRAKSLLEWQPRRTAFAADMAVYAAAFAAY